jgi:AraC-like DNA-binding protein
MFEPVAATLTETRQTGQHWRGFLIPEHAGAPGPEEPGQRPPRLHYQPKVAGADRFWGWRDIVSPFWDIAVENGAEALAFQACASIYHLGSGILARGTASAHSLRRTPAAIAQAGVDHIILQVHLRGSQLVELPSGMRKIAAGDVCFIDMAQPFAGTVSDHATLALTVPRDLLAAHVPDPSRLHGMTLAGQAPPGYLLARHIEALAGSVDLLSPPDAVALVTGTAALAASCCAQALGGQGGEPEGLEPAALLAIRRYIERDPGSAEMTAGHLAMRFGLSRSALYRLFTPLGGVAEYVRRRRLARAYRELTRPRRPGVAPRVAEVARNCGFESDAVFSRAFRRCYGFSPRDARAAASPQPQANITEDPAEILRQWVLELACA